MEAVLGLSGHLACNNDLSPAVSFTLTDLVKILVGRCQMNTTKWKTGKEKWCWKGRYKRVLNKIIGAKHQPSVNSFEKKKRKDLIWSGSGYTTQSACWGLSACSWPLMSCDYDHRPYCSWIHWKWLTVTCDHLQSIERLSFWSQAELQFSAFHVATREPCILNAKALDW